MIDAAARAHPEVSVIGLNVKDTPNGASEFIATYLHGTPMIHLADADGTIPVELGGGRGVPLTFFYDADGLLVHTHRGVIDEPTLATLLDEIDR